MNARLVLRYGPMLLAVIVAAAVNVAVGGAGGAKMEVTVRNGDWGLDAQMGPDSPLSCPDPALAMFSERAAGLTGAVALVEPGKRQTQAAAAAREIHSMVGYVTELEGGAELTFVLADLAAALERYAGSYPSALVDVRDASARNAELRATLYQRQIICGGKHDE